jgi:pimeloyl-ACP methyl ester carboxylesterase
VRAYADAYREDVAALVLEDSAHPDQTARLPEALRKFEGRFEILLRAGVYTMPFGLPRMIGFCDPDATAECSVASLREMEAERAALEESSTEVRAARPLGNLPLRVLSRDPSNIVPAVPPEVMKSANQVWQQLQEELAQLSTDSARVIATGSGHYIHREKSNLFVSTVRDLVAKLR